MNLSGGITAWGSSRCWNLANMRNYSIKSERMLSTYLAIIRMEL